MKIVEVEDGSEEWHALRRCRLTASRMPDVMAGKQTKRYRDYQREIVRELLGDTSLPEPARWAEKFKEMEPRSFAAYEWKFGHDIEHDLFLIHDVYDWLGCSPDALIKNRTAGIEFKSRLRYPTYLKKIQRLPPENRHQVQACMWVTGFDQWEFCNYHEHGSRRKLHRRIVERDDKLISQMEERSLEFMTECYELACIGD